MKRYLSLPAVLLCTGLALLSSCTINDNNGDAAVSGNPVTEVPAGMVPVLSILNSASWVAINDTLPINIYLKQDTSVIDTTPLAGAKVTVTVSGGSLLTSAGKVKTTQVTTGSNGRVQAFFTDSINTERTITVSYTNVAIGTITKTMTVSVTDNPDKVQRAITASVEKTSIPADDSSYTFVMIRILDGKNNPVAGEAVQFQTSAGTIMGTNQPTGKSGQSLTDATGLATAKIISTPINTTAHITAWLVSDETMSVETQVAFTGVTISATLDSSNVTVGGVIPVVIQLRDGSGDELSGTQVYAKLGKGSSSPLSLVMTDTITDNQGRVNATIRGLSIGSDTLIINAAGAKASYRLNVTNLKLRLTLESGVLQADTNLYTKLDVDFSDVTGSPLKSKTVTVIRHYITKQKADTTDTLRGTTNASGHTEFRINALSYEASMRLEVIAKNTATDMATADANVSFIKTRRMSILATPNVISADGTSASQITVQVKNERSNPIVGDSILFSSDAGVITEIGITDANGQATATLRSDRRNTIATVVATLARDISQSDTVLVTFNGISISTDISPRSITADGIDSSTILIKLSDAGKNPITGEIVNFFRNTSTTRITGLDSVTNNRGEARCRVRGTGTGSDTISIRAAGAEASAVIYYSSNRLVIDTLAIDSVYKHAVADGKTTTRFRISYRDSRNLPIVKAYVEAAVTMGSLDNVFAISDSTDASGYVYITVTNPNFPTTLTIDALATGGGAVTAANYSLYYRAIAIARVTLVGTPSVISVGGDRTLITAVAYDSLGNRVSNAHLAFNIINGPGGGEYLTPATAVTALDGSATTYLVSGTLPSEFNEVKVVAGNFNSDAQAALAIKSDTVKLTIAGPPFAITLRHDFTVTPIGSTYGWNLSAIITDVNGNPVADGTPVTFSAKVDGFVTYSFGYHLVSDPTVVYAIDTGMGKIHYFDDFNGDFNSKDTAEMRHGGLYVGRGEDVNGDGRFMPGPQFHDINWNGRRDFGFDLDAFIAGVADGSVTKSNYWQFPNYGEWPEPLLKSLWSFVDTATKTLTMPGSTATPDFVDYSGNKQWDWTEPTFVSEADYFTGALASDTVNGRYIDVDWNNNGSPDPQTTVLITKTVMTSGGIADNKIVYGKSDGLHISALINAECKGLVCKSPIDAVLPIAESDAKYWSYRE